MSESWRDGDWGYESSDWNSPTPDSLDVDPNDWSGPQATRLRWWGSPIRTWQGLGMRWRIATSCALCFILLVATTLVVAPSALRGVVQQSVSPLEMCVDANAVYLTLASGFLASEQSLDVALSDAEALRSQTSGDAELDIKTHDFASAAIAVQEAIRQETEGGLSPNPSDWTGQLTSMGQPLEAATSAWGEVNVHCQRLLGSTAR